MPRRLLTYGLQPQHSPAYTRYSYLELIRHGVKSWVVAKYNSSRLTRIYPNTIGILAVLLTAASR